MSRKRAGPRRPAARPKGTRAARRTRWVTVTAAVVAIAIAAWLWTHRGHARSSVPADPISVMDPYAALMTGSRLGPQGRHQECIPYYRRAVAGLPASWEARVGLSSALFNSALEGRPHLGFKEYSMRSTFERVRNAQEAIGAMAAAVPHARTPRARALTIYQQAVQFRTWGFALEALERARAARQADPTWASPDSMISELETDFAGSSRDSKSGRRTPPR